MNYICIKKGILFNHYLYCDSTSYEADKILMDHDVFGIKFYNEVRNPDYKNYCIIFAKVPRWKSKLFKDAMNRLEKIMSLSNPLYIGMCEDLQAVFKN